MKKKNGVTKKTLEKNVRKFARESSSAWFDLEGFVKKHCKRSEKARQAMMDELCPIVDRYININCHIRDWCHKNGVELDQFICDVVNMGFCELGNL